MKEAYKSTESLARLTGEMTGREYWDFLDEFNGNLLYTYISSDKFWTETTPNMNNSCYLIWFVFYHTLGCHTTEEAANNINAEIIKRYKLLRIFTSTKYNAELDNAACISIGLQTSNPIKLIIKNSVEALSSKRFYIYIRITLEILYNRYNYLEQLECYIKQFSKPNTPASKQPTPVIEAKKALKESLAFMQGKPEFEGMLKQYYSTRREILGECYYEL